MDTDGKWSVAMGDDVGGGIGYGELYVDIRSGEWEVAIESGGGG